MTMEKIDVVIVGAGFAGISAVYKFKQQGLKAVVFEAGSGVGGDNGGGRDTTKAANRTPTDIRMLSLCDGGGTSRANVSV